MATPDGVKVIEYNARFGDPETQVVLPRLESDLLEIFEAVIDQKLDTVPVVWSEKPAVCVILASGGYPEKYETGYPISGIENAEQAGNITVFHAGTKLDGGEVVTAGGRVLGVTAVSDSFSQAILDSYAAARKISFTDMHFRTDIGKKTGEENK